jgi:hypothetical protein
MIVQFGLGDAFAAGVAVASLLSPAPAATIAAHATITASETSGTG